MWNSVLKKFSRGEFQTLMRTLQDIDGLFVVNVRAMVLGTAGNVLSAFMYSIPKCRFIFWCVHPPARLLLGILENNVIITRFF